jgi:hypothetical protein
MPTTCCRGHRKRARAIRNKARSKSRYLGGIRHGNPRFGTCYHRDGMVPIRRNVTARAAHRSYPWARLDDAALLRLRFRDLRLRIEDSPVWPDIERVYAELERRGIRFKPHVWLSESWFSPDGVPGIAVPFFAAHPRLGRLERRLIGYAEGGSGIGRLQLLRHEAAHALDAAYGLRRRADWRRVFGRASLPYHREYVARPSSRDHVLHLRHWYAQSHPTEDFAETFAVWLQPKARWRREYAGWPALDKLEYVDGLMAEIEGSAPRNRDRSIVAPLSQNATSLERYYRRKAARYGHHADDRYDRWLERVFARRAARPRSVAAARFVGEIEPELRRSLVRLPHGHAYLADHAMGIVKQRARELDLVLRGPRRASKAAVRRLHERVLGDVLRRDREHGVR